MTDLYTQWYAVDPQPVLMFSEIPPKPKKKRKVRLFDVHNPSPSEFSKNQEHYFYLKAKLIKGFEDLHLNPEVTYKMYFPIEAFLTAWNKSPNTKKFELNKKEDCVVTFIRPTIKSLKIVGTKWHKYEETK